MTDKIDSKPEDQKEEEIKVNDNIENDNNEQKIDLENLYTPTDQNLIVEKVNKNINIKIENETGPINFKQNALQTECPLNDEDNSTVGNSSYKNSDIKNLRINVNNNNNNDNNNQISTNEKVGFYQKTKNWFKQKWQNLYFRRGPEMEEVLDAHGNKILITKNKMNTRNVLNNNHRNNFETNSYDPKDNYKNINYNTYVSLPDVFSGYLY